MRWGDDNLAFTAGVAATGLKGMGTYRECKQALPLMKMAGKKESRDAFLEKAKNLKKEKRFSDGVISIFTYFYDGVCDFFGGE